MCRYMRQKAFQIYRVLLYEYCTSTTIAVKQATELSSVYQNRIFDANWIRNVIL